MEYYELHDYISYQAVLEEYVREYGDSVKLYSIGKSVEGRDIYAMDILPDNREIHERVMIIAGQHGSELAGPEAALKFIDIFLSSDDEDVAYLRDNMAVTVVPCVNVDQYARHPGDREYNNANNIDLNSTYRYNTEEAPESLAVIDNYVHGAYVTLAFDLHETNASWMEGFTLYETIPRNREDLGLGRAAVDAVSQKYAIHGEGIIHDYNPNCFDGFAADMGAYSFTFETPGNDSFSIEERIDMHIMGIFAIMERYYLK